MYHGTTRACNIGDDNTQVTACQLFNCGVCSILRTTLDPSMGCMCLSLNLIIILMSLLKYRGACLVKGPTWLLTPPVSHSVYWSLVELTKSFNRILQPSLLEKCKSRSVAKLGFITLLCGCWKDIYGFSTYERCNGTTPWAWLCKSDFGF